MSEINLVVARRVIEQVGSSGVPPAYGFHHFTAGLDPYMTVIDNEYLGTFIKQGGSTFKMVVGVYGGGKTHFLYCVRDLAWKHHYVVSYVSLSPGESPFHKLELVYKAIVRGLIAPLTPQELLSGYEQGIISFVRSWYAQQYQTYQEKGFSGDELHQELLAMLNSMQGITSISFSNAIKEAFTALLEHRDEDFSQICQWLSGEGYDAKVHKRFGILQRLDRTTAFVMLRSLLQWIRLIGFSGLVILLDEAERVPSLSTKQREQHLNNLREIIDECGHTTFQGSMIFYAVPDENFLEGQSQVYEALRQRLATVFERFNPTGVKIELESIVTEPVDFLSEVGQKLAEVYMVAYDTSFSEQDLNDTIRLTAESAYEQRFGDIGYKRLFVQTLIKALNNLRYTGLLPTEKELTL